MGLTLSRIVAMQFILKDSGLRPNESHTSLVAIGGRAWDNLASLMQITSLFSKKSISSLIKEQICQLSLY